MSLIKDCIGTPLFAMPQGVIEPEKEKHLLPGENETNLGPSEGEQLGVGQKGRVGVFILPAFQGETLSPGKVPGIERRDGMVLPKPPISPPLLGSSTGALLCFCLGGGHTECLCADQG